MRILAYETSGNTLSVALTDGKKILAEMESGSFVKHSDALVPMIEKILKKTRTRPEELDLLALDVGPGSFTGIRVGVMTAKMLATVWKIKIAAVSSLEGLARSARISEGAVAVLVDARKGKVYAALYENRAGKMKALVKPLLTTAQVFMKRVKKPAAILTEGVVKASAIAEAASEMIARKEFVMPEKLEPLYLHPRDCNVTAKKK